MRKLVIVVITILAIFTFIREYPSGKQVLPHRPKVISRLGLLPIEPYPLPIVYFFIPPLNPQSRKKYTISLEFDMPA